MQPSKPDTKLIHTVMGIFQEKYSGNENAANIRDVLAEVNRLLPGTRNRKLRAAIEHIRANDLMEPGFILSDVSCGYWYSTDKNEFDTYIDKQMNRMANEFANLKPLHQRIRYGKKERNVLELFTETEKSA